MNIRYAYCYTKFWWGAWSQICFPLPNEELPQPKGYIEDAPIDDYENSCLHVYHTKSVYTDGTNHVSFGYTGSPDVLPGIRGVCNYGYYTCENNETRVWTCDYGDSRYVMFKKGYGGLTAPPDFLSVNELREWLLSHDFQRWISGNVNWSYNSKSMWLLNPPITENLAHTALTKLMSENPLEPELSSLYFSLCAELKFNSNNIANVQSLCSIAKSLLNMKSSVGELAKTVAAKASDFRGAASDAWLSYRYVYSTTKSDVEEASRLIEQLSSDTGFIRGQTAIGSSLASLKIRYAPYDNPMLNLLYSGLSGLQRLGLDPSLVNMWDMIPFSFIADWFIPIGDNLQRLADQKWAATMPYQTECLASQKGTVQIGGWEYSVYHRFSYSPSYDLAWVDDSTSTYRTWSKRVLDVIALKR